MSDTCYRCFKAKEACLCPYIKEVDPGVKFVLLMHPREAYRMRTGTGRVTKLCLKDSEVIVCWVPDADERVRKLMSDPAYYPVLLYPGKDAKTAKTLSVPEGRKLLVFILDGTWPQAKKMLRLSPNLRTLPSLSFSGSYTSSFRFKKEPKEECVSTIEAAAFLIRELQAEGKAKPCDTENMLNVFGRMVDFQLESERLRHLVEDHRTTDRLSLSELKALEEKAVT